MKHADDIECQLFFGAKQKHVAHVYIKSEQGICCDVCVLNALAEYLIACDVKVEAQNPLERLH